MEILTNWLMEHLVLGVLVMTRMSTLLMSMPSVGVGVPKRVRAFLAITLTALVLPPVASTTPVQDLPQIDNLVELAIAIAREGLIGLLIGATVQLIITGLQMGGEMITSTGGMQLGDAVDPTTSSSMPSVARLVGLLVTAVMLLVGGHRLLLGVLLESFHAVPAGNVGNLVTGLISRTLPQINVLAIGLSINALAMLVILSVTIGSVGLVFQSELATVAAKLSRLW